MTRVVVGAALAAAMALCWLLRLVIERDLGHWGPRAARRVVRLAVRVLPEHRREVRAEEWLGVLAELPADRSADGPTGLAFAVGVLAAAGVSRLRDALHALRERLTLHDLLDASLIFNSTHVLFLAARALGVPVGARAGATAAFATGIAALAWGGRRWLVAYPLAAALGLAVAGTPVAVAVAVSGAFAVGAGAAAAFIRRSEGWMLHAAVAASTALFRLVAGAGLPQAMLLGAAAWGAIAAGRVARARTGWSPWHAEDTFVLAYSSSSPATVSLLSLLADPSLPVAIFLTAVGGGLAGWGIAAVHDGPAVERRMWRRP